MRHLVLGLLLLGACTTHAPNSASGVPSNSALAEGALETNSEVLGVTDGDTITVRVNGTKEKVRLIGIDTPETKKPDTPVQCFGPEASAFTASLLPVGTPLHLERDVEARDKYGRLLAYAYLATDGTFVNLQIVRQGFARLLTFPPNVAHVDEFVAAARAAEAENIGLWAGCTG
jgi:micrococcal nuclease